jgi:hypothetical protein
VILRFPSVSSACSSASSAPGTIRRIVGVAGGVVDAAGDRDEGVCEGVG